MEIFKSDKILIFDGAMGTMLQRAGLKLGERPEMLCLSSPEIIKNIHKEYIKNGAEIIYTNTFGANALKLEGLGVSPEEIISCAVKIARKAVRETNSRAKVALDIGPLGELLEPSGTLSFERAYELFREMVVAGERAGADLVVFETMTDLAEVRAGVLSAKESSSLPVLVSMTFEKDFRTFTGASVMAEAIILEGLGVDGLGINCSLGPKEILPMAKLLCEASSLPVFVKPNAGLPDPETSEYKINPKEFARELRAYGEIGIRGAGGCCGTTPEFIRELKNAFDGFAPIEPQRPNINRAVVSTATNTLFIDDVAVIGERINPTGKKLMREALLNGDMGYIMKQAVSQLDAGAKILDVNVGAPGVCEEEVLPLVVKAISSVTDLPLQIDSSSPKAIENALRIYNGKAIVNSVNGKEESLRTILPICKKYGASVVGLTLDENGIPDLAEDRLRIAKKILETALSYGIKKEDVFIDCLTLTVSAQQDASCETLKALRMVKEQLGLKTVLGVSNISFGLPNRQLLNSSFLMMALENGLDMPIINPNAEKMMDTIRAFRVLKNIDKQSMDYIDYYKDFEETKETKQRAKVGSIGNSQDECLDQLTLAIKNGLSLEAREIARERLSPNSNGEALAPMELVNNILIPALDLVGELFEAGKIFLPQLLQSASAAQEAFDEVKKQISSSGKPQSLKGSIVLATVHGDIHDIGKNIVKTILENYGYNVIDLGRDVPAQRVVDKIKETGAELVGLSALMTTTLKSMEETISLIRENSLPCKIMVGGAVLTEDYALKIGADFYARDAKMSADIAKRVIG